MATKAKVVAMEEYSVPSADSMLADARLNVMIERGRAGLYAELMFVTPEMARAMLRRNTGNRPIRPKRVDEFARVIKAGLWRRMAQGISFSADGILNNGQHRLLGVIKAGVGVDLMVAFGEDREVFYIVDTQARRNAGDALSLAGEKNAFALAGAVRILWLIERGIAYSNIQMSNSEVVNYLEHKPGLRDSTSVGHQVAMELRISAAAMVASHYLMAQVDRAAADAFMNKLRSGLGMVSDNDPVHRLRERMRTTRFRAIELAALTIKSWNYWRANKPCGVLRWRGDEEFPAAE